MSAANPKAGLVFYPKAHRYKLSLQPGGPATEWCPGVTTLIGKGLPKPALMYWSARAVAEYVADHEADLEGLRRMGRGPMVNALKEVPWNTRDTAAVKGTDVHALAQRLVHGEEVQVPEHLKGYVDACVRFLDEWAIKPLVVERPVGSRQWRYCGTPDLVAELSDGTHAMFDYKTSASGIFGETALQQVAYARSEFWVDEDGVEHPTEELNITATYGVHLRDDGTYDCIPLAFSDAVFKAFLHIAYVGRMADEIKSTYTGEAANPPQPIEGTAS